MWDFFSNLGSALLANKTAKTIGKRNYGDYAARQGLENAQGLANAFSNPNDPTFKEYQAQELDKRLMDYQMGLQDLINQNRREQSRGRKSLFDEERGGEQIWRALQLGRGSAESEARDAALKRMGLGYDANTGLSRAGANLADYERERKKIGEISDYYTQSGLGSALARYFQ